MFCCLAESFVRVLQYRYSAVGGKIVVSISEGGYGAADVVN